MPDKPKKPDLNIYQKLIEIRKSVSSLPKDTKGYNYKYTAGATVLASIRDSMNEFGVLLSMEVLEKSKEQVKVVVFDKQAKSHIEKLEWVIDLKICYTWINAENPEDKHSVPFPAFGQQADPSHAFGSALTYSERYFILKQLQIPTDDSDPDNLLNGKEDSDSNGGLHECPLCKEQKAMVSKYPDKGKYYCVACKQNFESLTGNNSPKETLKETLKKLVDNKDLYSQLKQKHKDSIEQIFISDIDPNDAKIHTWIDYLAKFFAGLDKKNKGEKITTQQLKNLMAEAVKNKYDEKYVNSIVKTTPFNYQSKKDILKKDYDAIMEKIKIPLPF